MPLQFGDFTFDHGRRELRRGSQVVRLSPKAYHLLELLIESAPNAVSRDELYQGLWPDTFVDDANLPNLIKELRRALDDDSRNPRFIKTLHRFGYAFNETPRSAPARFSSLVIEWAGRDFPLCDGINVLGRDVEAGIRIDSVGVSRRHAEIVVTNGKAFLRDLESKNGTFVHGTRVETPIEIATGDEVRLGSAVVRLRSVASSEATMTVAPSTTPSNV